MFASLSNINNTNPPDFYFYKCNKHDDLLCSKCLTHDMIFINSCYINCPDVVKFLSSEYLDLDYDSALIASIRGGNLSLAKLVLAKGTSNFSEAFMTACRMKYLSIIKYFAYLAELPDLEKGLCIVSKFNKIEFAEIILDAMEEDIFLRDDGEININNAFIIACQNNYKELFNLFLRYKPNLEEGAYIASTYGFSEILETMVIKGLSRRCLNTCLISSIINLRIQCTRVILENTIVPDSVLNNAAITAERTNNFELCNMIKNLSI